MPRRNRIKVNCSNCNEELERRPWEIKRSKDHYCDKYCMIEHRRKTGFYKGKNNANYKGGDVTVKCVQCENKFTKSQTKYNRAISINPNWNFFCCEDCYNKWRSENNRGENAYNWRGGITELTTHIRACRPYLEWRAEVYKRDRWTCQDCGYKGSDIEAHHKMTFADIIQEHGIETIEEALECEALWNTDNGITLCKDCHKKEHRKLKVA